ncbi:hypothetical protein B0A48_02665 [Cryoendolithus antarcticus]|uniref:Uncharacterized protein n=1 Tax=Cryoendolithus antarcticus TaxID=1507870 RepID=A0A1V8TKY4_9PEZI|nr:hypothetical protein B0A48_02665 [Cryoendolithus antarcticus]
MASTNHAQRIWPALNTKATNTTTVLQPQSRLLSLVPELRTKIFEYAVEESNPIVVIFIAQNFKTTSGKKRIRYSLRPAHPLLVVSEQTRSEAQIFYWTQDTFLFNDLGLNYKTIETFNYITMIDKYLSKVAVSRTVRVPMLTQTGVTSILIFPLHFLKLQLIRENNAFSITPMSDKAFLPLIDSTVTTGAAPLLLFAAVTASQQLLLLSRNCVHEGEDY